MFKWVYMGIGGIVGAALIAVPVYIYGKQAGRHAAKVEQLEASVEAYVKREGIENEVSGLDKYAICLELGGLPEQCDELRGVEETTTSQ